MATDSCEPQEIKLQRIDGVGAVVASTELDDIYMCVYIPPHEGPRKAFPEQKKPSS
jgi:hypothetical protein